MFQRRRVSRMIVRALLATALLAAVPALPAQQSRHARPKVKKPAAAPAPVAVPVAAPVPFRAGETLEYRVLFSKYAVNAARIETSVIEQRNVFGRAAWHFRAIAHTMDTTRMLFAIDDQLDSYTAAASLHSIQFEMYLHEQGKQQTSLYRMTTDNEAAPADATAVRVVPGTRDAIGYLYALRAVDWQHTPEFRAPVFDGHRLYDAVARMDTPQASVTVPAGTVAASRIAIQLFDHGKEITDTRLWLWLARNEARTPVLIEADIPIGTSRIELLHLP